MVQPPNHQTADGFKARGGGGRFGLLWVLVGVQSTLFVFAAGLIVWLTLPEFSPEASRVGTAHLTWRTACEDRESLATASGDRTFHTRRAHLGMSGGP